MDADEDIRQIALGSAAAHGSTTAKIVLAKLLGVRPDLRPSARDIMCRVQEIVEEVNAMDSQALERYKPTPKVRPTQDPLPPLPDAIHGSVVTRFPPEPNGYPHIGHAKAAIINHEYARMYGGRMILRMDDTNPAAERLEYYAAIKVDLEWLGVRWDAIKNTSDDMELLHQQAARLIHQGDAYVCTCSKEKASENRKMMKSCQCRHLSPEENHSRWARMQTKYKAGEAVLRYRGDMASANTTMRDPVLFRIIDDKHPLLGTKYRTWPSYDLAIAVEDSLDGVTHAFRSKEYEMRQTLYHTIQDSLGLRRPKMDVFSRLSLQDMPVSKRLIRPLLERGHIAAFDDPRLPTLSGLRRRGIRPEAIRKFVLSLGFTKSDTISPFATLESYNRTIIDPTSTRLHAVRSPIRFAMYGAPAGPIRMAALPGSDGTPRTLDASGDILVDGSDESIMYGTGMVRLMGLGDVVVEGKTLRYVPGAKADIPKIQWVGAKDAAPINLLVPHPPFSGEEFDVNSLEVLSCMTEPYYLELEDDSMIQFIRLGYARKESARQAIFSHK